MNILSTSRFKSRGFTLLELIATIVIVGILSTVATTRFFDQQDFEERGYVDEIASSMRYAQRIATASNCEVNFTINALGYSATQPSSPPDCGTQTGPWVTQVLRSDGSTLSGSWRSGITPTPVATLIFLPDGSLPTAAPTFTVGQFTINVDQFSGKVTVRP